MQPMLTRNEEKEEAKRSITKTTNNKLGSRDRGKDEEREKEKINNDDDGDGGDDDDEEGNMSAEKLRYFCNGCRHTACCTRVSVCVSVLLGARVCVCTRAPIYGRVAVAVER